MILEILGKVGFDWRVALANLVNFLIIYLLLRRFAFEPIGRVITERQKKIKLGLEDAKKAKAERENAEKKREDIIDKAKKEAHALTLQAADQSKEIVNKAKGDAEEGATKIKLDTEAALKKEEQKMKEKLAEEAGNMVAKALKKTLEESVDENADKAIVAGMIKKFEKA